MPNYNQSKMVFIGGSGRSGTTILVHSMFQDRQFFAFPHNIELKFLISKYGIIDLFRSVVSDYSPDRASVALKEFEVFYQKIALTNEYGQPKLMNYVGAEILKNCFDKFANELRLGEQVQPMKRKDFMLIARELIINIYQMAFIPEKNIKPYQFFIEKTPHNLLHLFFLKEMFPESSFIHIMRDPRAVVLSLQRMDWMPNSLQACIDWLKCYIHAYIRVHHAAKEQGIKILELQLEKISLDTLGSSRRIVDHVGAEFNHDFLSNIDNTRIYNWDRDCTLNEAALLTKSLHEECLFFGYEL